MATTMQPDWYELPSQPSYTKYDAATYRAWVGQRPGDERVDDPSDSRHRRSFDWI